MKPKFNISSIFPNYTRIFVPQDPSYHPWYFRILILHWFKTRNLYCWCFSKCSFIFTSHVYQFLSHHCSLQCCSFIMGSISCCCVCTFQDSRCIVNLTLFVWLKNVCILSCSLRDHFADFFSSVLWRYYSFVFWSLCKKAYWTKIHI